MQLEVKGKPVDEEARLEDTEFLMQVRKCSYLATLPHSGEAVNITPLPVPLANHMHDPYRLSLGVPLVCLLHYDLVLNKLVWSERAVKQI